MARCGPAGWAYRRRYQRWRSGSNRNAAAGGRPKGCPYCSDPFRLAEATHRRFRAAMLSAQRNDFRTFEGIAREEEISNHDNVPVRPLKKNEIGRRSGGIVGIENKDRRSTIHQSRNAVPVAHLRVSAEVLTHVAAAPEAKPVDKIEANILGQHVADAVEIAGIEPVDVGHEAGPLGLSQGWRWTIVAFLCQLTQPQAAPLQRAPDSENGCTCDI